jgi:hypothetical protein
MWILEGGADQLRDLFIGCSEHCLHFIPFQELSLKRFVSEFAKIHYSSSVAISSMRLKSLQISVFSSNQNLDLKDILSVVLA